MFFADLDLSWLLIDFLNDIQQCERDSDHLTRLIGAVVGHFGLLLLLLFTFLGVAVLICRRRLHIDGEMLEQLVLVLVIEAVREENATEKLNRIVEQILPRVASQSI